MSKKKRSEQENDYALEKKQKYNGFKLNNAADIKNESTVSHRTEDPPLEELMLEIKTLNFQNKQTNKRPHKTKFSLWTKMV